MREITILHRALAFDSKTKSCTNNMFVANKGTIDHINCEKLVQKGFMNKYEREWRNDSVFLVTNKGKEFFLKNQNLNNV